MLLLGFAGAFRRSELLGLTVADISVLPDGLRIRVKRLKTVQEGRGQTVWISKARTRARSLGGRHFDARLMGQRRRLGADCAIGSP